MKHPNGTTIDENIVLKENDNSPITNNKTISGQSEHETSTLEASNVEQNVEDLSNSKNAIDNTPIETTLYAKGNKSLSKFKKGKWIVKLERVNV